MIRFIQVAVPSRGEVDSYQRFKRHVEESVGRINGACGTVSSNPVHYMHQSVSPTELVALYRAADAMLVTPLPDGMNLVAKEFVASRVDEDGVLGLSEFAGAAAELDGAVTVNPYDVDAVLLADLADAPGVDLDLVSGRVRSTLEAWFGHLPVSLWAEHGFWHRPASSERWHAAADVAPTWIERIKPIFGQFAAGTPGSHVEIKSASIAWHYRRAQREFGARQAHELRMLLGDALSDQPCEVIAGRKVIEVRLRGVSKVLVAHRVHAEAVADCFVTAIGDDCTDEDFSVLCLRRA